MGMTANDAMKIKTEDEDNSTQNFREIKTDATCKMFNFRIRAKMETYNDQPR